MKEENGWYRYCPICKKRIYPNPWSANWDQSIPPTIYLNGTTNFCEGHKTIAVKVKGKNDMKEEEKEKFFRILSGLYAYDIGATDSGIKDDIRKEELKVYLHKALKRTQIYPDILSVFVREYFLSDDAVEKGYGLEDVKEFIEWLAVEMNTGGKMDEEKRESGSEEESDGFCIPSIDVDREGYFVICGTTPKNGTIFGGSEDNEHPLDLTGLNSLLIADLDYFVEHNEEMLDMVKDQIEKRNQAIIYERL